jgi:hypothetical protein
MRAANNVAEKTFYIARSDDGICHIGEIEPGQSFATGLRTCQLETDEQIHYANMEAIAVPWELGLTLTESGHPVSHEGKLYKVNQDHPVVDPNHTPDIVPALYTEIQAPTPTGYPAWVQPTGAHDAYALDARVSHVEKNWRSTIPVNTTEPGTLLPWGYWVEYGE